MVTDQDIDTSGAHDDAVGRPLHDRLNLEVEGWAIKEKHCECGKQKLTAVFLIEDRFLLRDKSAPDPLYFALHGEQTWVRVKIAVIPGSEARPSRKL